MLQQLANSNRRGAYTPTGTETNTPIQASELCCNKNQSDSIKIVEKNAKKQKKQNKTSKSFQHNADRHETLERYSNSNTNTKANSIKSLVKTKRATQAQTQTHTLTDLPHICCKMIVAGVNTCHTAVLVTCHTNWALSVAKQCRIEAGGPRRKVVGAAAF